ncbi:TRAP transporter small permease subunit [Marinobacter sp. 1-3A]|uniref:TRAP transporter small permease n=1 Tax=Marinobacter sp. 1-3A TaxID=2582920 RepID=UPI001906C6FF|nr:TRAP transporter small permease subunit [Marinobacter sp. 1-3A]MBK1875031.1 TRAP transporter small permease subunit [Marinobacter sp. 1-3A]
MANLQNQSSQAMPSATIRMLVCSRGFLAGVEKVFLYVGAICVFALAVLISSSVFLRTVFNTGIPDEIVIVGEFMIGALILPLAFVAADRGFITVEIFTQGFGVKVQQVLNVLTSVFGVIAVAPITYAAYLTFFDVVDSGAYFFGLLELPKWPGRSLFFFGYILFFIRLIDLSIFDLLVAFGVVDAPVEESDEEGAY